MFTVNYYCSSSKNKYYNNIMLGRLLLQRVRWQHRCDRVTTDVPSRYGLISNHVRTQQGGRFGIRHRSRRCSYHSMAVCTLCANTSWNCLKSNKTGFILLQLIYTSFDGAINNLTIVIVVRASYGLREGRPDRRSCQTLFHQLLTVTALRRPFDDCHGTVRTRTRC